MSFKFTKPVHWENKGAEPSENLQNTGFQGGYKPPAGIFNYFFYVGEKCLLELQNAAELLKTNFENFNDFINEKLNKKVDKIEGKGLSENDYTTAEKNKLSGIESGAQKNSVTGIKGNAEIDYRTGNVNLTPANIGAATASHTHNYAGSSSEGGSANSAVKLDTARTINGVSFDGTQDITIPRSIKHIHATQGTNGSMGYVKICTIKVTGNYVNEPVKFTVTQRNVTHYDIVFMFHSAASTDPDVQQAYYISHYKGTTPLIYYVKSAASTWDIYIKKTENYDCIYVLDCQMGDSVNANYKIIWTDTQVSSLPTGYVQLSNAISVATSSANGLMSVADKAKLDSIGAGTLIAESTQLTDTSATLTITNDLFKTLPFVYAELYCKNRGDNHMSAVLPLKTLITTEKTYYISSCGLDGTVYRCDITCSSAGTITAVFKTSTSTTFKITVYKT